MTDTPVNTWELAQNIPEDMSKPQNPLPVTITPGKDGQSDLIEDMDFSFDGYQVVRGEFFAHTFEPSFTFNNYKVSVNMACIKKLPSVEYVQILVNPEEKKLAVRPCREEEKTLSVGVQQEKRKIQNKSPAGYSLRKLSL